LGETLSDIIETRLHEGPRQAIARPHQENTHERDALGDPVGRAGLLAALGAVSLMGALGVLVGQMLRSTGH
jgi:hypothetical protein